MYGSKADHLIKLKENQFQVPTFVVIPFEDYKQGRIAERLELPFFCERYAVRSSSNLEDGSRDSFAGQFQTYLNVGREELEEKIAACFRSLDEETVAAYMKQKEISYEALEMNVIVQEMVDAELSGVLFCANPQGLLNESVVVVGKGLGEGVVSDRTETTAYYYNLHDGLYYYEGEQDYLSAALLQELIETAQEIQALLGSYLDIEFAIAKNKIYILQARKITTISDDNPLILDNSNIVESYPGLSLPLTVSFVHSVYSGVFESLSRRILKNEKELAKHKAVFKNMVGAANGRLYYKISNWYTLIQFLPFHKRIIPIWQEMLGVKNKSYEDGQVQLSFGARMKTYINSFCELLSVQKNMERLNDTFLSVEESFYREFHEGMDEKQILALYKRIEEELLVCWDVTLLNDLYAFLFTGLLKKRMKENVNAAISGMTNMESLKPIRELVKLAYEKDKLTEEAYEERFISYIRQYGDRNLEELKLESLTFRTNPELLSARIEEYRSQPDKLEELYENMNSGEVACGNWEAALTRWLQKRCMRGICNREKSRLNRSRIYGMVRWMMLQIGTLYTEQKLIDAQRDIFYLTLGEVRALADKKTPMQDVIAKRKADYKMFSNLPAYSRLIFAGKEFDKSHTNINNHAFYNEVGELRGIPCSNGVAEGEALVIRNVTEVKNVKDKILITKMTDPGWVFLLATAKGVISEKGSLLSHTAIISRELKIPSIVGVSHLMDSIESGDLIRMDGEKGTVEILEKRTEQTGDEMR